MFFVGKQENNSASNTTLDERKDSGGQGPKPTICGGAGCLVSIAETLQSVCCCLGLASTMIQYAAT